jgi:hypothetical protein
MQINGFSQTFSVRCTRLHVAVNRTTMVVKTLSVWEPRFWKRKRRCGNECWMQSGFQWRAPALGQLWKPRLFLLPGMDVWTSESFSLQYSREKWKNWRFGDSYYCRSLAMQDSDVVSRVAEWEKCSLEVFECWIRNEECPKGKSVTFWCSVSDISSISHWLSLFGSCFCRLFYFINSRSETFHAQGLVLMFKLHFEHFEPWSLETHGRTVMAWTGDSLCEDLCQEEGICNARAEGLYSSSEESRHLLQQSSSRHFEYRCRWPGNACSVTVNFLLSNFTNYVMCIVTFTWLTSNVTCYSVFSTTIQIGAAMLEYLDLSAYTSDFFDFALIWLEGRKVMTSLTICRSIHESIQASQCVAMWNSMILLVKTLLNQ